MLQKISMLPWSYTEKTKLNLMRFLFWVMMINKLDFEKLILFKIKILEKLIKNLKSKN